MKKSKSNLKKALLLTLGIFFSISFSLNAQLNYPPINAANIDCCSPKYHIEAVNSSNQPGTEIYAHEVWVGTNQHSYQGAEVEITADIKVNSGITTIVQGLYQYGRYESIGFCNSEDAANFQASNAVDILGFTDVISPGGNLSWPYNNGFTVNANYAKYFYIAVFQNLNGNWNKIFEDHGDVVSNWMTLWNGVSGVSSGNNHHQDMFLVVFKLNNCAYQWPSESSLEAINIFNCDHPNVSCEGSKLQMASMENAGWTKLPEEITSLLSYNEIFHNSISIHPNPSENGLFTLAFDSQGDMGEIRILDSQGRMIEAALDHSTVGEVSLDLSGHPSGLYLLNFTLGGQVYTERIVVK